jgi:hypothetical protein
MTKYSFNKETGTLEPKSPQQKDVIEKKEMEVPQAKEEDVKNIVTKPEQPNVDDGEEAEVVFRQFSDLSIMRVDDQATGKWLCYFSGYALDIKFNMEELKGANASKKIEAALEGLNKLFRKIILDQAVGG